MKTWTLRLPGIFFFMMLFLIGIWFLITYFFVVNTCRLSVDSFMQCNLVKEMQDFVIKKNYGKPYSSLFLHELCQKFPVVESASCRYTPNGTLHCLVRIASPFLSLNSEYYLLSNDEVVSRDLFQHDLFSHLPCLKICKGIEEVKSNNRLLDFIRSIPEDLHDVYSIEMIDRNSIYLKDKKDPTFVVLVDHQSIRSFDRSYCDLIKSDLIKKGSLKNQKKEWIVDVRFKNQVIVRSEQKRGGVL